MPNLLNVPSGCPFHPRCDFCEERCVKEMPKLMEDFKRFGAKMIPKFTVREQACGLIHYLSALEHTLKYDKLLFIKGDKK